MRMRRAPASRRPARPRRGRGRDHGDPPSAKHPSSSPRSAPGDSPGCPRRPARGRPPVAAGDHPRAGICARPGHHGVLPLLPPSAPDAPPARRPLRGRAPAGRVDPTARTRGTSGPRRSRCRGRARRRGAGRGRGRRSAAAPSGSARPAARAPARARVSSDGSDATVPSRAAAARGSPRAPGRPPPAPQRRSLPRGVAADGGIPGPADDRRLGLRQEAGELAQGVEDHHGGGPG